MQFESVMAWARSMPTSRLAPLVYILVGEDSKSLSSRHLPRCCR